MASSRDNSKLHHYALNRSSYKSCPLRNTLTWTGCLLINGNPINNKPSMGIKRFLQYVYIIQLSSGEIRQVVALCINSVQRNR
uniref:Uncharacterized protein n=1 Tax=Anguilla anguilla TaxID=7936 RepID=A0A0E9PVI7_ANGAN